MSVPRLFVNAPLCVGRSFRLPESGHRHLYKVLRARPGSEVRLFNGEGGEYEARVGNKTDGMVEITAYHPIEREAPLTIHLLQCLISGRQMDYAVQKSVELGAASITPIIATRSQNHGHRAAASEYLQHRRRHWQGVVIASCEQCGRNVVPPVAEPIRLDAFFDGDGLSGFCPVVGASARLTGQAAPAGDISLLIGPEGGLTGDEQSLAERAGLVPVGLGDRVLRAETVAPAMLAACQSLWGDW